MYKVNDVAWVVWRERERERYLHRAKIVENTNTHTHTHNSTVSVADSHTISQKLLRINGLKNLSQIL